MEVDDGRSTGLPALTLDPQGNDMAALLSDLEGGAFPGFPLSARASRRMAALGPFSEAGYVELYPDVAIAGMKASDHALLHAAAEGRPVFLKSGIARAYGCAALELAERPATTVDPPQSTAAAEGPNRPCTVFVSSESRASIKAAALDLGLSLQAAGFRCSLADETADYRDDHGVTVFVAPHDFFYRGLGPLWLSAEIVRNGFLYNTEPLSSIGRTPVLAPLMNARGLLESSAASDRVWRAAGIPSCFVERRIRIREAWLHRQELDHPLILAAPATARRLHNDPRAWRTRSIDVLCFDTFSERRSKFFGTCAADLSHLQSYIYLRQGAAPGSGIAADEDERERISGHLAANAKVTLTLSEDGLPEFDGFRVFDQGFAGGSVVVSDSALLDPRCAPGLNYFHEERRHIPQLIRWLLNDREGMDRAEAVQRHAFETIRATNSTTAASEHLARFMRAR